MGVPYRIVVEPQEFDNYAQYIDPSKILTLPFSNLGQGSIPARNWVWEHSIQEGHQRHWILDVYNDNAGTSLDVGERKNEIKINRYQPNKPYPNFQLG